MAISIDQSFVRQYEREVHEAYQRQGSQLRGTVRTKNNVRGTSTTFQKVGSGAATQKARHGAVPTMNLDHSPIVCTLEDWYAADWVDRLDELKINHDERGVVARAGAWGLGRKTDDLIITAAIATTTSVGSYATGATRALLLEVVETLDVNDVPDDGNRWGLLTPRQWSVALTISEFSDADFVGDDLPFMKRSQTRSWLGVNWMRHTGINGIQTATADCLIWHQTALGHAIGADVSTDIWWDGDRQSHKITNKMSQGACLIDVNGIVEFRVDDTAAIPA